jgi:hypothetical protein
MPVRIVQSGGRIYDSSHTTDNPCSCDLNPLHLSAFAKQEGVQRLRPGRQRQGIFASQRTFETSTSFSEPTLPPVPMVTLKCTSPMLRRVRLSTTEKTASLPMEPYLVKETFTTDHAQLTTGNARWATNKTIVWFVMIKDAKNRFPNNPLWVMDGDGHFSKPMRPISKSQPTSKRIASAVMFQLSQPTGYTYKVTQSSNRSKQKTLQRLASETASRGELQCTSIC